MHTLWILAGLGNPGSKYEGTRHNIGYWILDALATEQGQTWKEEKRFQAQITTARLKGHGCLLVKPTTYMNNSGQSLGAVARYYKCPVERFVVIYDEYQLPTGEIRLALRGGDGGHNGIKSIKAHLGDGFTRFRVGIAPRHPRGQTMADYVLDPFSKEEQEIVNNQRTTYLEGLGLIVDTGPQLAMNHLNQKGKQHESPLA